MTKRTKMGRLGCKAQQKAIGVGSGSAVEVLGFAQPNLRIQAD